MRQLSPQLPTSVENPALPVVRRGEWTTANKAGNGAVLKGRLRRFSRTAIVLASLCLIPSLGTDVRAEGGSLRMGDLKVVAKEPPATKPQPIAFKNGDEEGGAQVSLDQAIALALDNNKLLEIARQKQEQSQGELMQARSGYLPQLGVEGNYSEARVQEEYPGTNQKTKGTVGRGSVRFSQLLYDFGKTTSAIDVGKYNLDAAGANLKKEIKSVFFKVKKAYFDVLEKKRLIEVTGEDVKSFTQHLERTRNYYNAGVRTRVDVINAEVELSNANKNLTRAGYNLKIAKANFDQVLGIRPHQGRYTLKDVEVKIDQLMETMPPVTDSIDTLIQEAVKQRADVAQLTKLNEAARASVDKTWSEYLPVIKAEAKVNEFDTKLSSYDDSAEVGVTASWELFSGLNTTGALTSAQGRLREYRAQLQELQSIIASEVTESWLRTAENRESVEITLKTLALAKENVTLAEKRYQTGAYDVLEFNEAQRNLTKARAELVVNYYGYLTSVAKLDHAVGR